MRRWISPRRSEAAPALDTAVRFLAQRPRSEYEVRRRLQRAGVDEAAIDATIVQLRQMSLLDDAEFVRYWVGQRRTFRPRGPRLLRAELARLGVSRVLADAAASAVEPSAEEDAYRAGRKRAVALRDADEHHFAARLGGFLARRGFDWETVSRVVGRLWREVSTEPRREASPDAGSLQKKRQYVIR